MFLITKYGVIIKHADTEAIARKNKKTRFSLSQLHTIALRCRHMSARARQITGNPTVWWKLFPDNYKENFCLIDSLCGETTDSLAMGQWCRRRFAALTSWFTPASSWKAFCTRIHLGRSLEYLALYTKASLITSQLLSNSCELNAKNSWPRNDCKLTVN